MKRSPSMRGLVVFLAAGMVITALGVQQATAGDSGSSSGEPLVIAAITNSKTVPMNRLFGRLNCCHVLHIMFTNPPRFPFIKGGRRFAFNKGKERSSHFAKAK